MPETYRGARALPSPLAASVVTLGTFDGVHVGHQQLVKSAITKARELGVPAVAYTFDPHPAQVLAPHVAPRLLATTDERVRVLTELGIDIVILETFNAEFASIPADDWVREYLVGQLQPRHVVVGFNFTYGQRRGGDTKHLQVCAREYGFTVDVCEAVQLDGEVVSSTVVRKVIEAGQVDVAARLLGRPYALTGEVVQGDQRGRTIGFSTANLPPSDGMLLASGVYATQVVLQDGRRLNAVTNVGTRPTFDGKTRLAETHIFDFSEDIYGQAIRVEMIERLRAEQKFDGIEALTAQIQKDVAAAKKRLAR